jgi:UTP-glucose-1-phosphate uridylyltransferase
MSVVIGINHQINPSTQPQKAENRANYTGISFNGVFEVIRKSMDGIMVVAENNKSGIADLWKEKLEIEEKRKFKTDLEEAQDILNQIARIMERQGKGSGK